MIPELESENFPTSHPKKTGIPALSVETEAVLMVCDGYQHICVKG
jgi:hypothetical protein